MKPPNFEYTLLVHASARAVFEAITSDIPKWWSEEFSGQSKNLLDEFTVRFGTTYKVMCIVGVMPDARVVWECTEALLNLPELSNKSEWEGTRMQWQIEEHDSYTNLHFTHVGLTPKLQCFEVCEEGWTYYLNSLKQYLENGKGNPRLKMANTDN